MCSVCWLLLVKLERLLWGSLIVARGSSPQNPGWRVFMIFLVYCVVWLCDVFVFSLRDIFRTLAWYSLYVLKVPLNTNQLTNWWILSPAESGFYSFSVTHANDRWQPVTCLWTLHCPHKISFVNHDKIRQMTEKQRLALSYGLDHCRQWVCRREIFSTLVYGPFKLWGSS